MLQIYKDKRVFVTGHTGFKGSWLCSVLETFGAITSGFSLEPYTAPSHFNVLKSKGISTIGDIRDSKLLKESLLNFQPEIVFHLAAQPLVKESYNNPVTTYQTNVIGTLNVLEAIRECKAVKAVIIITTDKVYENHEWLYPYRENDQLGGYDMYSSSKACCELLTSSYRRSFFNIQDYKIKHNVLIATARAGNVIGGGDWSNDRLIPDVIKATIENRVTKIRNPLSIRPWQHVLDCIYGYLLLGRELLNEEVAFADAWNFSPYSFESKTVHQVLGIAKSVWPDIDFKFQKLHMNFHEASTLKLDNTKALSLLGWQPKWNTEESIEKTISWYKSYYLNHTIETFNQIKTYFTDDAVH